MKRELQGRVFVHHDESEAASAELVIQALEKTKLLLKEHWLLELPGDCHLLVMTSWRQFLFNAAPISWRIMLALTLPLWVGRVESMWKVAGGWTNRFGQRSGSNHQDCSQPPTGEWENGSLSPRKTRRRKSARSPAMNLPMRQPRH